MLTRQRGELVLAASLAAVAGFVDAVGFVAIGGFFVSFMTGNTTRAAVALVDGQVASFALAAGIVGCFVIGVVGGSLVADVAGPRHRSAVLLLVAVILSLAAALYPVTGVLAPSALMLAAAMGAENAAFDGIGLTYMTGTLVKMGQNIAARVRGRGDRVWPRYLAMWAALSAGALLGALTYSVLAFASVLVAVGAVLVAATCAWKTGH